MMRCVKSVLIGLALLLEVSVVQAGVYHITTGGSDAAAGSSTSPWRTLGKANSTLVAGDVVIVHGGAYSDGISPTRAGVAGSPITYQVASGEHVVLNVTTGIKLGSASRYITVDGFEIRASYRVVELVGSSYITIRNCLMYGGRGNYSGFSLEGASYCVIQNNYYNRQDPDGSSVSGNNPTGGDGLRLIGNSQSQFDRGQHRHPVRACRLCLLLQQSGCLPELQHLAEQHLLQQPHELLTPGRGGALRLREQHRLLHGHGVDRGQWLVLAVYRHRLHLALQHPL